jgi:hypothetical protein
MSLAIQKMLDQSRCYTLMGQQSKRPAEARNRFAEVILWNVGHEPPRSPTKPLPAAHIASRCLEDRRRRRLSVFSQLPPAFCRQSSGVTPLTASSMITKAKTNPHALKSYSNRYRQSTAEKIVALVFISNGALGPGESRAWLSMNANVKCQGAGANHASDSAMAYESEMMSLVALAGPRPQMLSVESWL